MKNINNFIAMLIFLASSISLFAVDALQISVQSSNAVLSWPSFTNESYVVQYRNSLNATDVWVTLNGNVVAADGTNLTFYTDPNTMNFPVSFLSTNLNISANTGDGIIPTPPGGGTNTYSGGSTYDWIAGTGFYRVLGVHIINGITNGATVSDYINIMVRPDADAKYLSLIVDGQSFPNQSLLAPPFTNADSVTFIDVDTAALSNGVHTVQVEAAWVVPAEQSFSSGYELAYSQPITVYVTNEISYPAFDGDAGDGWASFDVQSLHPAVDWEMDIYNYYDYLYWFYGYTDTIYPIKVATGNTTNGMIHYLWNMVDDGNNVRTNLYYDPAFFSFTYTSWTGDGGLAENTQFHPNTPGSGGSAQKPSPLKQSDSWPSDGGYWVVAWQDMLKNAYDDDNLMESEFNGWLSMASEANPIFYQTPIGGTNAQTWPLRYNSFTNSTFLVTNADYPISEFNDVELLNTMLHDSRARNFYGYGHGGKDFFIGLEAAEIQTSPMHRYRFVWLDGCNTAKGSWDAIFHINGPGIFDLTHYQAIHKRPAVFMGYTEEIPYCRLDAPFKNGVRYDGTIPEGVPFFRSQFVFYWWLEDNTLRQALTAAINTAPDPDIFFKSGPLNGTPYHLGDYLQVEGYDQLGWNDYNDFGGVP